MVKVENDLLYHQLELGIRSVDPHKVENMERISQAVPPNTTFPLEILLGVGLRPRRDMTEGLRLFPPHVR